MKKSRTLHIAFDPIYAHPLPEGHRFPMLKYELIPQQLLYEGTVTEEALFALPGLCNEAKGANPLRTGTAPHRLSAVAATDLA